jgi:haloalkane dehalogenase
MCLPIILRAPEKRASDTSTLWFASDCVRMTKGTEKSMTNAAFPSQKKRKTVLGLEMAYVEEGQGGPIVFLHGNPTSSYAWRHILPYVQEFGRVIAPDLIGMGDSQKLPESGPGSYTFVEHRRYLDALLDVLDVRERVILVGHDWGAALAFDWARRHPDAVRGIAFMEAVAETSSWSEYPAGARERFQALRSPAGEQMVLEQNSFIEFNLPATILRTLTEEEMNEYRRPFAEPGEARRPTLTWPRQLPIDGEPADVTEIVTANVQWLASSPIPKLCIAANPGTKQPKQYEVYRTWPAYSEVTVRGHHTPQEDSPEEIGQAIARWLHQRR